MPPGFPFFPPRIALFFPQKTCMSMRLHASPCMSTRLHACPCVSMHVHAFPCPPMCGHAARHAFPPGSPCFSPRNMYTRVYAMSTPCPRHVHAMYMTFWGKNRAILGEKSKDACPHISRHVQAWRGMDMHGDAWRRMETHGDACTGWTWTWTWTWTWPGHTGSHVDMHACIRRHVTDFFLGEKQGDSGGKV